MFQIVEGKLIVNEKRFRIISPDKLVIDTKYLIGHGCTGIYKGTYLYFDDLYRRFETVYNHHEKKHFNEPRHFLRTNYYELVSQPQWNMERRSVNMILRRLIGDDCFEW